MAASGSEQGIPRVLLHDLEDFSWLTFACILPLCLWWGGQGGGAGYKQVVFNISPHWIFFLVIPVLKKVGFWVRVHCGTEFCLHWLSNASSFHFLFLLSRRKLGLNTPGIGSRAPPQPGSAQKSSLFISETLVSLLCLAALHEQLGSAPALLICPLSHCKCSSLFQAKMQNVCEEQGFICSITASDPEGIAEVWHKTRLCAWSHWSQLLYTRQDISVY